ncbi:sulfate ABC transporter substrate-binding protein [Neisseria sp. Ec49-e6-T10]|uniref:sulfate ABC transporter substrate-binding protein n=1 Tax=Neisseria sp. Ec49-e6-T10 TaxID=3140744 RepID=UPI003EC00EF7
MKNLKHAVISRGILVGSLLAASMAFAQTTNLMNVSYDVTRDFYKAYNPLFEQYYQSKTKQPISIRQSHGGSSKQAMSVLGGLQADVVTMNQASDINLLLSKNLVKKNWVSEYPNQSNPFSSATVFLVRKGNPKNIKDWDDLIKNNVSVIAPNPKTSGNGRYAYLAAWTNALKKKGGNETQAKNYVKALYQHIPVLDAGARGATISFIQRNLGDVLITPESEAKVVANQLGKGKFEVVYPNISLRTEAPVAVVTAVTDKRKTTSAAHEYLNYLWSEPAQELAAKYYFRPNNPKIAQKYKNQFPQIKLYGVTEIFGSWENVNKQHFATGALFDQIYQQKNK